MNATNTVVMNAKRDGFCANCGKTFRAGERFLWHKTQYMGYCVNCPTVPTYVMSKNSVADRQDVSEVAVKKVEAQSYNVPKLTKMFDGRFTIPFFLNGKGRRRHVTLWITTRKKGHKYEGSRRIRLFHGRDNTVEYVDVAYVTKDGRLIFSRDFFENNPTATETKSRVVKEAIKILVNCTEDDQLEFGMQYAMLSRRCFRCNRVLTNPDTLKLESKCGPICDKFMREKGAHFDHSVEPQVRTISI